MMRDLEKSTCYVYKTIAIYGNINDEDNYIVKNIAIVGKDMNIHAEKMVLMENKHQSEYIHAFFYINRFPCIHCLSDILYSKFKKITLIIPSRIKITSTHFKDQIMAADILNRILNKQEIDDYFDTKDQYSIMYKLNEQRLTDNPVSKYLRVIWND